MECVPGKTDDLAAQFINGFPVIPKANPDFSPVDYETTRFILIRKNLLN
jgi:hypothetical protein